MTNRKNEFIRKSVHTKDFPTGIDLLNDSVLNKGTAFTMEERDRLDLQTMLPDTVHTLDRQVKAVMENFSKKPTDIEKYIFLMSLLNRNETLFYRVCVDYIEEMMPIIYTPTVGQACEEYGHIFRHARGAFFSSRHRGRLKEYMRKWPYRDIRVIVVTDGERILGLGDLGADGMGIPVGKLALYTACAGIHPEQCLPVTLDVGTENKALLEDPLYIGVDQHRLQGDAYDDFIEEFVEAVEEVFPSALIQFEDFANHNAFRLLRKYRDRVCAFNDDIQGTAAVALAGIYSALRITKGSLPDQTIMFMGAGEAGIGIANLIVASMVDAGLARDDAMRRCWFIDSKGLLVKGREQLAPQKLPFAHEHEPLPDLLSAVEKLKPTILIGCSGQTGAFDRRVIETMATLHRRPVVMALSNPTSKAECTAEQAYSWSDGRAVFASGSPFPPFEFKGRTLVSGQGNNAYIFPGMGLGIVACGITRVTDEMFFAAARCLAEQVGESDLEKGCIYPPLNRIREVSAEIAVAVAEVGYRNGLARETQPEDLLKFIQSRMYEPVYHDYLDFIEE